MLCQLVNILFHNCKHAVVFAQTCKEFLKIATNQHCLIRMISLYKNTNSNMDILPSFFYTSLPHNLINIPYEYPFDIINYITHGTGLNLINCCVASGEILKSVYNVHFLSLINIWTHSSNKHLIMTNEKCKCFNSSIINGTLKSYEYISTFDLSIHQHGIVYDNLGNPSLHITPLSLYTYYTKDIIVSPRNLNNNLNNHNANYIYNAISLKVKCLGRMDSGKYIDNPSYQGLLSAFFPLASNELNHHLTSSIDNWCIIIMKDGYKFSYVKLSDNIIEHYQKQNDSNNWCQTQ